MAKSSRPANLERLRTFAAVARHLSYSRAAEELFLTQPAVSKQVHALEDELGAQLAGQAGRRVYLTEAGRLAYDYARRIFVLTEDLGRALEELAHLERGYLRVGASSTPGAYLLPPVLAAYRDRYPGIGLSVRIANSREIEEAAQRHELDVGLVGAHFLSGLQVSPWVQDTLALIVPPAHRFAGRRRVPAAALAAEPFILREPGSGTRHVLEAALAEAGVALQRPFELAGCEAVKQAVAAGLGIAAVSQYSVACELAAGRVRQVSVDGVAMVRPLHIVTPKDVRAAAAALAFLALLRKTGPPLPGPDT
ncbi:MAG: LysR family transcriptional regulator [Chloroflexi bacterium]|nr:LysR family transcriptional regulator [Chloroflexota bacterium]